MPECQKLRRRLENANKKQAENVFGCITWKFQVGMEERVVEIQLKEKYVNGIEQVWTKTGTTSGTSVEWTKRKKRGKLSRKEMNDKVN